MPNKTNSLKTLCIIVLSRHHVSVKNKKVSKMYRQNVSKMQHSQLYVTFALLTAAK